MTTITYVDTTLRDGSHALHHQMRRDFVAATSRRLAAARVPYVEVGHGAGIGGSSILMGESLETDADLQIAAREVLGQSELVGLLVPGFGTAAELEAARDRGLSVVRAATHATEGDVAIQHLRIASELGLTAIGFLMMTHTASPDTLAEQARIMVDAGAKVVYLADSAGYMLSDDVSRRVEAIKRAVDIEVGVHMHNNLGYSIPNSVAGIQAGATWVDGSLGGLGAGAGNAPGEVLVAVLDRLGYQLDVDVDALMDTAEDVVRPEMHEPQIIDRASLVIGLAGVYSSFLHRAREVATTYGVDARLLLTAAGERHPVAGQEDLLEDIALQMVRDDSDGRRTA